jgi:iron complex transport system substrate-binding protein
MTTHRNTLRVVSLLPSATDTLSALLQRIHESDAPFYLCGCSHECDPPPRQCTTGTENDSVGPIILTSSRLGSSIPIDDIQAAFSSSIAAVEESLTLGIPLAVPLLQYGLSAYELDIDKLREIRPDVILTCLQTAHSCVLEGELADMAFEAVLGYCPKVVHTEGQSLEEVFSDMTRIADAVGLSHYGRNMVGDMQTAMEDLGRRVRSKAGDGASKAPSVSVIQWATPIFAAGAWVLDMMRILGVRNAGDKWEDADVVVWSLCGLGLNVAEREVQKVVMRRAPTLPCPRMAVMDGVRMMSRPGPLLLDSLIALSEILDCGIPGGEQRLDGRPRWKWVERAV